LCPAGGVRLPLRADRGDPGDESGQRPAAGEPGPPASGRRAARTGQPVRAPAPAGGVPHGGAHRPPARPGGRPRRGRRQLRRRRGRPRRVADPGRRADAGRPVRGRVRPAVLAADPDPVGRGQRPAGGPGPVRRGRRGAAVGRRVGGGDRPGHVGAESGEAGALRCVRRGLKPPGGRRHGADAPCFLATRRRIARRGAPFGPFVTKAAAGRSYSVTAQEIGATVAITEQRLATLVLVIGTGGAGLRAAIELAEAGVDVLAVGKRPKEDAHTALAAGGINAALATTDPEDSWQQHAADTLKESYLLADPRTVEIVTRGAARGIDDLERYGMECAREGDGRISQRFFGAHTFHRTACAGDHTGLERPRTLVRRANQLGVPVLDSVYITRLLVHDGAVFGAYGFDLTDGRRYVIHADAVILAAGGHTRIWRRTSSRRDENTGDSFRLAVEAGARLRDPELVQFHPSGIIEPENAAGTLVSEAARGEGGILRNALGERFMQRYDPARMELSTRDRVALASYTEIKEGRGTPRGGVWLDVSHLPRQTIMTRLPRVYQTLLDLQMLDITREPVEVAPTAHYSMGGVWVR